MYKYEDVGEIRFLTGKVVQQVCYGKYDIQLNFSDSLNITVFGSLAHCDTQGKRLEINAEASELVPASLRSLIGQKIHSYEVINLESLSIKFSNDETLIIDGSSSEFECYTINYGGKLFVV